MTTTTSTVRAFGACSAKACRHRHVTMLEPGARPGTVNFRTADGATAQASGGYFPAVDAMMRAVGLVCPTHGATMRYQAVKGTYNPEKACDGRCMNAHTAGCDCSCGGENHGKTHA